MFKSIDDIKEHFFNDFKITYEKEDIRDWDLIYIDKNQKSQKIHIYTNSKIWWLHNSENKILSETLINKIAYKFLDILYLKLGLLDDLLLCDFLVLDFTSNINEQHWFIESEDINKSDRNQYFLENINDKINPIRYYSLDLSPWARFSVKNKPEEFIFIQPYSLVFENYKEGVDISKYENLSEEYLNKIIFQILDKIEERENTTFNSIKERWGEDYKNNIKKEIFYVSNSNNNNVAKQKENYEIDNYLLLGEDFINWLSDSFFENIYGDYLHHSQNTYDFIYDWSTGSTSGYWVFKDDIIMKYLQKNELWYSPIQR